MANAWQKLFGEVQRSLPKNATRKERGAATRRAAELWRKRRGKKNPGLTENKLLGSKMLGYAGLSAIGLYGWSRYKGQSLGQTWQDLVNKVTGSSGGNGSAGTGV